LKRDGRKERLGTARIKCTKLKKSLIIKRPTWVAPIVKTGAGTWK